MSRWRPTCAPARPRRAPISTKRLKRIAELDGAIGAFVTLEQGRRDQGRRRLDRALARRQAAVADRRHADRDQGHHRDRRHADRPGLADVRGPGVAPRFRKRPCAARSRRHHHRQDHHHRIRRHPSLAQDPEPARSQAHAGRLVERLVRRGRRRHGAGRSRHPGGRLDPAAVELLRRGRLQAERRRDQPQRLARSLQPELPGRHRRDARRHLGGAARHRRPRRRRSGLRRAFRRREFCQARQAGAARRARNRRLERHHRRRAQGVCRGQGKARQGRRRAQGPRRRSRHRGGREGDRRRAAADACHQRLGGPLAAQHLRRSRRRQAQRRRSRAG